MTDVNQPVEIEYDTSCNQVLSAVWLDRNPYGDVLPQPSPSPITTPTPAPTAKPTPSPLPFEDVFDINPSRIVLRAATLTLRTGGQIQLTPTVYNKSGQEIPKAPVEFVSYNPRVVAIDALGIATTKASTKTSAVVYARVRDSAGRALTSNFLTVFVNR